MFKKIIKEVSAYIFAAILVWVCVSLIINENAIQNSIINAVNRCLNVIIPSLFTYMSLSGIIIGSKIYTYISKPFYPIAKYIFNIPEELFFVFILGNIFGYPIGAKLLTQLVQENKISRKSAEIMNCFSFGGGPAFFTGTIGLTVFYNSKVGIIIFASSLITNMILALIMCRIYKIEYNPSHEVPVFSSDILIDSVISAGKSLFIICITIIFCSAIIGIIDTHNTLEWIGLSDNTCVLLKSIIEVSVLSELQSNSYTLIPIISAICSFGGICVLAQVNAIVGKTYSQNKFYISRLISPCITWLVCTILLKIFKPEFIPASMQIQLSNQSHNIIPTLCLIAMIAILFIQKKAVRN